MPRRRMRGGDDGFGVGDALQSAALVGTGAYFARSNPDSSVLGVVGIVAKYFAYAIGGLLLFFVFFFVITLVFGKKNATPPADTTNSASGTPPQ
jgi:phosphotransferase system  glucose/maltose/N-acetylglucosamine-specific IIC component